MADDSLYFPNHGRQFNVVSRLRSRIMCGLRIWGNEEHIAVDPVVCIDTHKQKLMKGSSNYPTNHVFCLNCFLLMLMLILRAPYRFQHQRGAETSDSMRVVYREPWEVISRYEHECHPNRDGPSGASRIARGWCPLCLSFRQFAHLSDLPDDGDEALYPPVPLEEVLDARDNSVLLHCPNDCPELRDRPVTLHQLLDHLDENGHCLRPASQGGGIASNDMPMTVSNGEMTPPF